MCVCINTRAGICRKLIGDVPNHGFVKMTKCRYVEQCVHARVRLHARLCQARRCAARSNTYMHVFTRAYRLCSCRCAYTCPCHAMHARTHTHGYIQVCTHVDTHPLVFAYVSTKVVHILCTYLCSGSVLSYEDCKGAAQELQNEGYEFSKYNKYSYSPTTTEDTRYCACLKHVYTHVCTHICTHARTHVCTQVTNPGTISGMPPAMGSRPQS